MRKKSTEHCVFQLLQPIAYSRSPLSKKLPELNIPIAFMYGENDWVSRTIADDLVSQKKVEGEVFETKASGHHLYFEAAFECVSYTIKFVHGQEA